MGTRQLRPVFAGFPLTSRAGVLRTDLRKVPGSEAAEGGTFINTCTTPESQGAGDKQSSVPAHWLGLTKANTTLVATREIKAACPKSAGRGWGGENVASL